MTLPALVPKPRKRGVQKKEVMVGIGQGSVVAGGGALSRDHPKDRFRGKDCHTQGKKSLLVPLEYRSESASDLGKKESRPNNQQKEGGGEDHIRGRRGGKVCQKRDSKRLRRL